MWIIPPEGLTRRNISLDHPHMVNRPVQDRYDRFVAEYVIDCDATKAAVRAGYSRRSAGAQAHVLMKDPRIKTAIAAELERVRLKLEGSAMGTLEEIRRISMSDIRRLYDDDGRLLPIKQWPDDIARCVASVKPTEWGIEVKLWSKTDVLKLKAQYEGLLVDRLEVDITINMAERLARARQRAISQRTDVLSTDNPPTEEGS